MGNHKETIAELTTSIAALEEQAADLQVRAFKQREMREHLMASMIIEEEMLAETNWEIRLDGNSAPFLELKDIPAEGSPMEAVENLVKRDYRSWIELSDGIKLNIDDDEITLTFAEPKQLLPFIAKNKLKISGTGIQDRMARLKREVTALEEMCHKLNIT